MRNLRLGRLDWRRRRRRRFDATGGGPGGRRRRRGGVGGWQRRYWGWRTRGRRTQLADQRG